MYPTVGCLGPKHRHHRRPVPVPAPHETPSYNRRRRRCGAGKRDGGECGTVEYKLSDRVMQGSWRKREKQVRGEWL